MGDILNFFNVRQNYRLQYYCENLGNDFVTLIDADIDNKTFREKSERFTNFMGRLPLIGRVSGSVRFGYGVIKAPMCAIAVIFALIPAGATLPFNAKISAKCLKGAEMFGKESLDGLKHAGRGIVEVIPIAGCYQFVQYDKAHSLAI